MGGLLEGGPFLGLPAGDQPGDQAADQQDQEPESHQVREDFPEGDGIADLPLEVVRDEGRRIDGHGHDLQLLRIEDERIDRPVPAKPPDKERRQLIDAFPEGGDDDRRADVETPLPAPPDLADLQGIDLPGADGDDLLHERLRDLGVIELDAVRHVLKLETVGQLVRDKNGVAGLERLQEGLAPGKHGAEQDGYEQTVYHCIISSGTETSGRGRSPGPWRRRRCRPDSG